MHREPHVPSRPSPRRWPAAGRRLALLALAGAALGCAEAPPAAPGAPPAPAPTPPAPAQEPREAPPANRLPDAPPAASPAQTPSPPATIPADDPGTAQAAALTLDLAALDYRTDGVDLFRSSAFYNPRTRAGAEAYAAFEDHYAVRPFGAFSWLMSKASSVDEFRRALESQRAGATRLAARHDKLIICINFMPTWLSRSNSRREAEGFYKEANLYGPRDADGWAEVIRTLAAFYGSLEADAEIYYEIWNEPDIHYWRDTHLAYLELYELTARTLRDAHPDAKIGGAAVSGWRGRIGPNDDLDPINFSLIKHAKRRELPLDFVSWHDFSGFDVTIRSAAEEYEAAFAAAGYADHPELVVSEWNVSKPHRGQPQQAAMMADTMVAFVESGIDVQTVAAWENFHPDPDPDPHGLVTQGGKRTGAYFVHAAFDGLARDAEGIAVARVPGPSPLEGRWRVAVARRTGDAYRLMIWRNGFDPAAAAAVQTMYDAGLASNDLRGYGAVPGITWAVRNGRARDSKHQALFEAARRTYEAHAIRARPLDLELADATTVEVERATAIQATSRDVDVTVDGNRLRCDLGTFEVLVLDLVVETDS